MKKVVLAISGSPRAPSFTEQILELCLEGMGDNLEIHRFNPHTMDIPPDYGFDAAHRAAEHHDDFGDVLSVYERTDYFLLATPLYVFGFPAAVKILFERLFVAQEPSLHASPNGGTMLGRNRFERKRKAAIISTCGFPELATFDVLRHHFRMICDCFGWQWSGELLVPAAALAKMPRFFDAKKDLIRKSGAEFVYGSISREIFEALAAPVMSAERYRKLANLMSECD